MARYSKSMREKAREFYLTGEVSNVAEIARRLKVKPHTVGRWKKDEEWDALRLKIDQRAAEQLAEKIASERVTLNSQHFKLWGVVVSKLFESLQRTGLTGEEIKSLDKVAGILDRAQKGQRLARGLSLDGQTEEQLRAEFEAEGRGLIDFFIDIVKSEVEDEDLRDRIARAILDRLPVEDETGPTQVN